MLIPEAPGKRRLGSCYEVEAAIVQYFGPAARDVGPGVSIKQWDVGTEVLTYSGGLDRFSVSGGKRVWLTATNNRALPQAEPAPELRRAVANFENLPVATQVYELSAEERRCSCCGVERKEIGSEESWQIEHIPGRFERLRHVRRKYACPSCERAGENPQIEAAAKAETAIEKGFAGPGLLAYIVTSKFADYVGFAVM